MRDGRLNLKVRLGVAFLAIAVLMPAAGVGLVVVQPASGIGLVEALVGRAIFRTISHRQEERADRRDINERRDAELAEVAQLQQALDFTRDRGWHDQATYEQETARLVSLSTAINERAKRERQIVSYQTRRNIRGDWTRAVEDVLTVSTGLNPRAVRLTSSLVRGERPITAVIDAALSDASVVDPRDQFRDLQSTLTGIEEGVRFVRDNAGLLARAQVTRMVQEMTGLPVRTPEEAEAALERLRELGADVEASVAQAGAIKADLAPRSSRIDRERFAENEKWIALNDNVNALSESTAERVVASAILRRAQERAEELLEGSGVSLTDEQLAAIARDAADGYAAARRQNGEVVDAAVVDMDQIVRTAANEALATAGRDPLPGAATTATATPTSTATGAPGPGASATQTVAADGSPSSTATGSPTPTTVETSPPGTTATPTTVETLPPGATATPTPTPTPSPSLTDAPTPTGQPSIVFLEGPTGQIVGGEPGFCSIPPGCDWQISLTAAYSNLAGPGFIVCSTNGTYLPTEPQSVSPGSGNVPVTWERTGFVSWVYPSVTCYLRTADGDPLATTVSAKVVVP